MAVHTMQELRPLPIAHRNLIWHAILEGKYTCQVRGIEANRYKGLLTIHDRSDKLLYKQPVEISYAAQFGPDYSDVNSWAKMCIHFVDCLVKKESK